MDKFEAAQAYIEQLLADMPHVTTAAISGSKEALMLLLDQAFYGGAYYGRTGKGLGE